MKKFVRFFLLLPAFAALALNAGPVFYSAEMNIGIITGFGFAALLIIYVIFFDRINAFIARTAKKTPGKIIITAVSILIIAGLSVGGYTFANIIRYSKPAQTSTEYIIVLGCRVNGTQPGRYLRGRINKAYNYLSAHPESKAVLSGGQGTNEDISEGRCMFNNLTAMGIDPSRLSVEDSSASTRENFANSVTNLKNRGVEISEITIVTNDFHEYRAAEIAKKNGLRAYPYPSETPWSGYLPFAVREIYAVIAQIYFDI